jgi:hypothetical protein
MGAQHRAYVGSVLGRMVHGLSDQRARRLNAAYRLDLRIGVDASPQRALPFFGQLPCLACQLA